MVARWWRLKQRRTSDDTRSAGRRIISGDWTPAILTVICGIVMSVGGFAITRQYHHSIEERTFVAQTARHAEAIRIRHARPDADRSSGGAAKTDLTAALLILFESRRLNECLKLLQRGAGGRRLRIRS